mmetsp:Transcript_21316/g.34684  ORF Transcript_21316/g.34684 Transcript_21316/m.34684 type:complete len:111 (-) Transcript_21316:294-626(-)
MTKEVTRIRTRMVMVMVGIITTMVTGTKIIKVIREVMMTTKVIKTRTETVKANINFVLRFNYSFNPCVGTQFYNTIHLTILIAVNSQRLDDSVIGIIDLRAQTVQVDECI